jgi:hypothetical protein
MMITGVWRRDAKGHWQLQAALVPQLLRLGASITATTLLLLVAAGVLTTCLNLQGLIASTHTLLYTPWLGALSAPGGVLADGLLKQVGGRSKYAPRATVQFMWEDIRRLPVSFLRDMMVTAR